MSEIIPYQSIYINSNPGSQGISGTGSNFTVYLRGSPIIPRQGRAIKVAVTTATIPLTYYGVNSTNNVINITETQASPAGTKTFDVTIPPGQYTSSSFPTAVQSAFNAASTSPNGYGLNYTITLSTDTGKMTFAISNTGYTISLNTTAATSTALVPLGLAAGTTPTFDSTTSYTGPNVVNIIGPTEFTIRCGNFLANIYETRVQSEAPILAVIPIVGNQFDSVIYQPAYPKLFGLVGSRLDRLDFLITDQNGLIVDLQNFGVTIQLALYDVPLISSVA